jgi:hypothetical protein
VSVPLTEASAKVRSGPPQDMKADLGLSVWAGEIPLRVMSLPPVADPPLAGEIPLPASVAQFGLGHLGAGDDEDPEGAGDVTPARGRHNAHS